MGRNASSTGKRRPAAIAEEPQGLWALDPQLICYSWMAGISDVALVVFVRKNTPEIQYLKTTIDEQQAGSMASWLIPRSIRLKRGNSYLTAGYAFPRTAA